MGEGLALVEPKPKSSAETFSRLVARQFGRPEKVRQETLVEPSSLEGFRRWGKGWP